jgi:hypothetical protein
MIKTKSPVAREPQFLPKICFVSAAAMTQERRILKAAGGAGRKA